MLSITNDDLNDLTRAARAAGRRRMNRNLHPALTDQVQRLLNAFEPGTYVRPHRHDAGRWELFLILRGRALLLEVKPGPYVPLTDKDFAAWAPGEGEPRAAAYEQWFRRARPGEIPAGL